MDDTHEWRLGDLTVRYNVGRDKVTTDFFGHGLPHHKRGTTYYFNQTEVEKWEIQKQQVPYGKSDLITLPAYKAYRQALRLQIKQAKANNDKEALRRIMQRARDENIDLGISIFSTMSPVALIVIIFLSSAGLAFTLLMMELVVRQFIR